MTDWKYEITEAVIVFFSAIILDNFSDDLSLAAAIFIASIFYSMYLALTRKYFETKIQYHWLVLSIVGAVTTYYTHLMAIFFVTFYCVMRFALSLIRYSETAEIFNESEKIKSDYEKNILNIKTELNNEILNSVNKLRLNTVQQKEKYQQQLAEIQKNLMSIQEEKIKSIELDYAKRKIELEKILEKNKKLLEEKQTSFEIQKENAISSIKEEVQKEIVKLKNRLNQQDNYIQSLEEENSKIQNEIFTNSELHALLLSTLNTARKEIDIMSPWVTEKILDENLRGKIRKLLKKGVVIKIAYGIENNDYRNGERRNNFTENCIEKLNDDFYTYKNFKTKKISSHGKIFICDDDYYVLTSMNPLSNDGSLWEEIGEKSCNVNNLIKYREKYFSF